jgi:hypothetical protein
MAASTLPGLCTVQGNTSDSIEDASVGGHFVVGLQELARGHILQADQRRVLLIAEDLERAADHASGASRDRTTRMAHSGRLPMNSRCSSCSFITRGPPTSERSTCSWMKNMHFGGFGPSSTALLAFLT